MGSERVEELNEVLELERAGEDNKMVQLKMQVHERGKISYGPERMVRGSASAFRLMSDFRIHSHWGRKL